MIPPSPSMAAASHLIHGSLEVVVDVAEAVGNNGAQKVAPGKGRPQLRPAPHAAALSPGGVPLDDNDLLDDPLVQAHHRGEVDPAHNILIARELTNKNNKRQTKASAKVETA